MNIAIVGCGFVFDIYMRTIRAHPELTIKGVFDIRPERMRAVSEHYQFNTFKSYEELLNNDSIELVVNLTNIGSHYEVNKQALLHGKHVYSEKPITPNFEETEDLFRIAEEQDLRLVSAPCNVYSDSVRTIYKAINDGAIGKPLLVYAELDDNPITKMDFDRVTSPTGAPWPLEEEIKEGCTYEHAGYHLVWICGLLGPAVSVTAFSCELLNHKMRGGARKSGTPDYSVACLKFKNGATARITYSVVAPRDHRMRIIGEDGEVSTEGYRQYQSPVYLERYSKCSLTARKFSTLCNNPILGKLFGIGGRRIKLLSHSKSDATKKDFQMHASLKQKMTEWLRRNQVYAQDKLLGISEMKREIENDEPSFLAPDFLKHINELTLLIQGAGDEGVAVKPKSSFEPLGAIPKTAPTSKDYLRDYRPSMFERLLSNKK